jgi:hypothetical protein
MSSVQIDPEFKNVPELPHSPAVLSQAVMNSVANRKYSKSVCSTPYEVYEKTICKILDFFATRADNQAINL